MYKIGYYSYQENPWKGLSAKMWEHHDQIFKKIGKSHDIEIHTLIMPTSMQKVEQYRNGDKDILVSGFRDIPIIFHDRDNYCDFDALFLEPRKTMQ